MDAKGFIDDMLAAAKRLSTQGRDLAEDKLGIPEQGEQRDAMLDGMGKGALAAGTLALLLGTGVGRRVTGTALKLGGLAAVGTLAYRAYQDWQAGQPGAAPGRPVSALPDDQAEARSALLLEAMVLAARADGHIDAQERVRIGQQMRRLGVQQDIQDLIIDALARDADIAALAARSDSPETAAEIYLVSRLLIDDSNPDEARHLDALAEALQLDPALRDSLDRQVADDSA